MNNRKKKSSGIFSMLIILGKQIQVEDQETNTHSMKLSTNKSPEAQRVEVPINTPQAIRVPYHHPHHKSRDCESRRQVTKIMYTAANELQGVTLS